MIELVPKLDIEIVCKGCDSNAIHVSRIVFQGIHILADFYCPQCKSDFYSTLPVGHAKLFQIQFSRDGSKSFYHSRSEIWLARPLIDSVIIHTKKKVRLSCQINTHSRKVVIVNCIDNCFGHVFTKIWNAYTLIRNHPELGVIVIVPAQCCWLVPAGVAEIWSVDVQLNTCNYFLNGIDEFFEEQLVRFDKVFLSDVFTHIDHSRYVDLEAIVKRKRFDLSLFSQKPVCITFSLREDRFWHNSIFMDLLFRIMVKGNLQRVFKNLFIARQNYLVAKTAREIIKELPTASIIVTGLGNSGRFGRSINDKRVNRIVPETEIQWNEIFSESHIVIGIHGSNMLIPSTLAAGFINVVPRYKIPHIAEDTSLPYTNRYLHFLGRHLDEYSSPRLVAQHAISMIRDFPYLYRNTEQIPE